VTEAAAGIGRRSAASWTSRAGRGGELLESGAKAESGAESWPQGKAPRFQADPWRC